MASMMHQLGEQIDRLRTEMLQHFQFIEAEQQQILTALTKVYNEVEAGVALNHQQLSVLQNRFDQYVQWSRIQFRKTAIDSLTLSFKRAIQARATGAAGWQTEYGSELVNVAGFATQTSSQVYYIGPSGSPQLGQLSTEVDASRAADLSIGLVPYICSLASVRCPSRLANPFALAAGAEAYMQLDLLFGDEVNADRARTLLNMWDQAIDIRQALNRVSSLEVIGKLVDLASARSGAGIPSTAGDTTMIGMLRGMTQKWAEENIKPRYSETPSQQNFPDNTAVLYEPTPGKVYEVERSPIDEAVALGLIALEIGSHRNGSIGPIDFFNVAIKSGPEKGKYFHYSDNGCYGVFGSKNGGQLRIFGTSNAPNLDIFSLLDYCESLLGYYYTTVLLPTFPSWLATRGFAGQSTYEWSDAASALRLAATVKRWRTLQRVEEDCDTDVGNIPILGNGQQVIDFIGQSVDAEAKQSEREPARHFDGFDPRPVQFHVLIGDRIGRDAEFLKAMPPVSDASVPVIDWLLRKLAGYMTAHGIEFQIPLDYDALAGSSTSTRSPLPTTSPWGREGTLSSPG
jgi:hypothetical protein